MDKKEENKICNGYESAFLFLNEEDFGKHLEWCAECKKEHAKMQRVSALIQEAKPFIIKNRKKNQLLKIACAISLVIFTSLSIPFLYNSDKIYDNIIAASSPSVEEMGLPVDEYGFLLVE